MLGHQALERTGDAGSALPSPAPCVTLGLSASAHSPSHPPGGRARRLLSGTCQADEEGRSPERSPEESQPRH